MGGLFKGSLKESDWNTARITIWSLLAYCKINNLTSESRDEHASIFDEIFDKPVGSLQLDLVALEPLSELGAVHERVAELQRRETHPRKTGAGRRGTTNYAEKDAEGPVRTASRLSGNVRVKSWLRLTSFFMPFSAFFVSRSPPFARPARHFRTLERR